MAGVNDMFNQFKEKAGQLTQKRADSGSEGPSLRELRQRRRGLVADKQKYFGFLGMAVYDLHVEKGMSFTGCEAELKKLTDLDAAIGELDGQIEQKEREKALASGNAVCEGCGAKLAPGAKFCGSCGAKVSLPEARPAEEPEGEAKPLGSCICGAQIMPGQFMCMECGRKYPG